MSNSKTAVVLSGGGSKGAFEVGVLKQLAKAGVKIDAIYGTSTGALNAVGYSFVGIDKLVTIWTGIKGLNDIFGGKFFLTMIWDLIFGKGKGIYNLNPLTKLVTQIVNSGEAIIPVTVCRVNLNTSAKEFISAVPGNTLNKANFIKAVVSSAATPVYNDLVDGIYCDGGVRDITPAAKAIADGATKLYIILAEPYEKNNSAGLAGNIINTLLATIGTMVQQIFWSDVQCALRSPIPVVVYAPPFNLPSPDIFTPATIASAYGLGLSAKPVFSNGK